MANADAPFGLKPIEHFSGHPWNGAVRRCYYSTAADLFIGTPVLPSGTGSTDGYMGVSATTAGNGTTSSYTMLGPVVAFDVQPSHLDRVYMASGDTGYVYVSVDPWVLYEVQTDGTMEVADIGNSGNLTGSGGSTSTGLSSIELSETMAGGDGGNQVIVQEFVQREDNDISSANSNWKVLINLHSYRVVDADLAQSYVGVVGY